MHVVSMLSRIAYPVLGIAYWQRAYKDRENNPKLNQEFVNDSEFAVKTTILVMIILGLVLDVLIFKYRWMARYLVYYEVLSIFSQGFVPFNFGDFMNIFLLMLMV